jgi:hypothetical protein
MLGAQLNGRVGVSDPWKTVNLTGLVVAAI